MIENWDQYKDLEYYPDRVCACGCGGKIKVRSHHKHYGIPKYIYGHGKKNRQFVPRETRTCAALGCNNTFEVIVTSEKRYCCGGHSGLGKHHSNETKEKQRQAQLGKHPTKETKEKQRQVKLGKPSGMLGKNHSKETIEKMRESHLGKSSGMLNKHHREESNRKNSETHKRLWQDPEYKERQLRAIFVGYKLLPNKPEKFLTALLQRLFPDLWKYIGDGKDEDSIVAGKCPDFIHVSQKKIIEHFGDFHHGEERTGVPNDQHEQERIDYFAKFGYQTLIIWEHELEDLELISEKITQFSRKVGV